MQKIPLNLAKAGMKLAKPIARDNGMVVAAEGLELTDALLERLANMEIERIVVMGNPVDMGGVGLDVLYAKRAERQDHLFRNYEDDKWMQSIKKFIKDFFELKAVQNRPPEDDEQEDQESEEQS